MNIPMPENAINHARTLGETGEIEKAGQILEEALQQFPDDTDLLAHLGFYYYQRGRWGRALAIFSRRNTIIPPDPGICRLLAEIQGYRGEFSAEQQWLLRMSEDGCDIHAKMIRSKRREKKKKWKQICKNIFHTRFSFLLVSFIRRLQERFSVFSILVLELIDRHHYHDFRLSSFLNFLYRYDVLYRQENLAYHKTREILLAFRYLFKNNHQSNVLDIGTGFNASPLYASRQGYLTVGLDGSVYGFHHLRKIQENLQNDGIHTSFVSMAGDATHLPFVENTLDGISALCMIEHIPGDGDITCMREIFRVLKPGGIAVITVECNHSDEENWLEVPYAIGYQSGEDTATTGLSERGWNEVFCRNYSPRTLQERLAQSTSWEILEYGFYDDPILPVRRWLDPIRAFWAAPLIRAMQPLLSLLFYRRVEPPELLTPSAIGFLVLRKPL